jgi:hypothetical protein
MNINYIDCILLLLLVFICLILYDSHKIISFIKKNLLYYSNYTENFFPNKQVNINLSKTNTRKIILEENPKVIQKQEQHKIIQEENPKVILEEKPKDIYDNYPDIEKNLFYYLTHPEPYNETHNIFEDNEYNDPVEQYLKIYKPLPLELENKTIRGHNFNELDTFPKITQFSGDIPLKNNEFTYAMADGYIFKDSAAI